MTFEDELNGLKEWHLREIELIEKQFPHDKYCQDIPKEEEDALNNLKRVAYERFEGLKEKYRIPRYNTY